jgi:hypothetical protein
VRAVTAGSVYFFQQVLRTCPGLRLSRLLLNVQSNNSGLTLPLGVIVTTLMNAAADDVAVQILMDVYDTRLERQLRSAVGWCISLAATFL